MSESYVPVFFDWPEATGELNDQEKGRLIDAVVLYARGGGDWKDRIKGNERFVFPLFKAQVDRSREMREARVDTLRENGKKGGRPKKNQMVFEETKGIEKNQMVFLKTNNNNNHDNHHENQYEDEYDNGFPEEEEDISDQSLQGASAVASAWRRCFGRPPNPTVVRTVEYWAGLCRCQDEGLVREAISAAAARDANDPVAYIIALFKDWNARGVRGVEDLD